MSTIWKYTLAITDYQTIEIPEGFTPLQVSVQGSDLCLWCKVDPKAKKLPVIFWIVGTGHPIPNEPIEYIGSAIMNPFVWHVFWEAY